MMADGNSQLQVTQYGQMKVHSKEPYSAQDCLVDCVYEHPTHQSLECANAGACSKCTVTALQISICNTVGCNEQNERLSIA